jgi:phosphoglycerol geranylgeranyltransferase
MSPHVDAIYFLSVLNSRSPKHIVGEQATGAPYLRAMGLEAIPMGYIIVAPGMKVGHVSEADAIERTSAGAKRAADLALAAQYFGMKLVYLECGSGAPEPCPPEIVKAVKGVLDVPLVVGGGLRTRAHAEAALEAGADILVTGTIAENGHFDRLAEICDAVRARRAF